MSGLESHAKLLWLAMAAAASTAASSAAFLEMFSAASATFLQGGHLGI